MNWKTLSLAIAAAGILHTAEAGRIVPPELRNDRPNPLVIVANLPMDFNVLPEEPASVTFFQDARNIRVVVEMTDSDVLSESASDQTLLHKTGDAVQIFISPENDTRMWELMADAANRKSCFFHWGPGRMFYPAATDKPPVNISAVAVKTASGWKADVTFPAGEVAARQKLPADTRWRIMVVRYNYGRNLSRREVSCFPQAVRVVSDPARFGRLTGTR